MNTYCNKIGFRSSKRTPVAMRNIAINAGQPTVLIKGLNREVEVSFPSFVSIGNDDVACFL